MSTVSIVGPAAVLEIGGTHVTAALIDTSSWTVARPLRTALDPAADAAEWLRVVIDTAGALHAPAGALWSVAVPGPFDYAAGVALFEGVAKFEGLYGVNVGDALLAGIEPRPAAVRFVNDANAFALGEWLIGPARGVGTFAAITLGTGIGSAFVRDGVVIEDGPLVPQDGEVHFLLRDGVFLEDLVSRRALIARYAALVGEHELDVREIADAARAGDVAAQRSFDDAFTVLGEMLVVGGSISLAWDLVSGPLDAGIGSGLAIRQATDPDRAALAGAAYLGAVASA
jgi:glucokinase